MQQEASVAIAIRAKDEASQAFQGIQKNLTQMSQRIEGTRVSTQQGTSAFGMMKGMLLPLAGGLLSTAAAFSQIKAAMDETTKSAASAEAQAAGMGVEFTRNLEDMRRHFAALSREFPYTVAEIESGFRAMQSESMKSDIALGDLRQMMEMATVSQRQLALQGAINGQVMRGNIGLYKQNETAISEFARSAEHAEKAWEGAISLPRRLGAAGAKIWERMGQTIAQPSQILNPERWRSGPLTSAIFGGAPSSRGSTGAIPGGGTVVNINIEGDLVATEDQQNQLARKMAAAQDQLNRGTR